MAGVLSALRSRYHGRNFQVLLSMQVAGDWRLEKRRKSESTADATKISTTEKVLHKYWGHWFHFKLLKKKARKIGGRQEGTTNANNMLES